MNPSQDELLDNLPESDIQPRPKFSIVWLVPLVAVLIGAWVGYKAWSKMGPTITITFKTAAGLEAGKTKIKYKNVEIGQVKSITVNHDTSNVVVTAEMTKDSKPYLTDQTRFWVVRARVNVSGVSGLETLLSGAYIGIDPSTEGRKTRRFTGLDIPPVVTRNIPGKHFILHTRNLGSLERDVPVYYRKFNVGQVEEVKLDDDGKSVTVRIFIRAPYDQWVNRTTKFWNTSGIDLSMSASGIKMNTESLVSILIGGIAFESHDLDKDITPVENNSEFKLYASHTDSLKKDYTIGAEYVINFTESVRGLRAGAPVEFRGIQLGEVTDIHLSYDFENKEVIIPVTVMINYNMLAFKSAGKTPEQLYDSRQGRMDYLVKQGMRAQLETGNLLTGQLYVAIDLFPDAPPATIDWDANPPKFPTMPGTMGVVKKDITSILKKTDAMLTQVNALSYTINHTLEPELSDTLTQTKHTLVTIEETLKADSPLQQNLQNTLQELTKAARSMKNLTDYLERHPESLLKGKKGD